MLDFSKRRFKLGEMDLNPDPEQPPVNPRKDNANLELAVKRGNKSELEFEIGGVKPPVTIFELTGAITHQPFYATGGFASIVSLVGRIVAESTIAAGSIDYNINVNRDPQLTQIADKYSANAALAISTVELDNNGNKLQSATHKIQLNKADDLNLCKQSTFYASPKILASKTDSYIKTTGVVDSRVSRWVVSDHIKNQIESRFEHGGKIGSSVRDKFLTPPKEIISQRSNFNAGKTGNKHYKDRSAKSIRITTGQRQNFEQAIKPQDWFIAPPIEPPVAPYIPPNLKFLALRDQYGANLEFKPLELEALIVMNEIKFTHISKNGTRTEITPTKANITLGIENHAWSLNSELQGEESLKFLQESPLIEVEVNKYKWVFVVTSYNRNRGILNVSYTFTADSVTIYSGEPYAPKKSYAVDEVISAWQMAEQLMELVEITVDRQKMLDWTLEPNSYSYSNQTPIGVLKTVTETAGGIVSPNMEQPKLEIKPRYKYSTWLWDTLPDEQCDHVLNERWITTESATNQSTKQANAVVIGGTTHGVITKAVLDGTTGDTEISSVSDVLAQDHLVNVEKARNLLCGTGKQEIINYSIPLPQEKTDSFSLIKAGDLVRIKDDLGFIKTGLCLNSDVSIDSVDNVWQKVSLEVHYGNS